MDNKPLVSIVLPVYNGANHVSKAIESILGQTYHNFELIIVNDCSTDNTLEILRQYEKKDSRIQIICNAFNLKLPATLNVGFSAAKGTYYTWTSDDNIYKPEAIAKMVEALGIDKSISMVYANYTNIDENDQVHSKMQLDEPEALIQGNVCGACFMYTAKIANIIGGYDVNLFLAEDYDYWLRIYANGRIKHIKDDLYFYRKHSQALSETRKEAIDIQTYRTIEKNFFPLYVDAKRQKKQYSMFDHMLRRCSEENYNKVKTLLIEVDASYLRYLKRKVLKENIRNSFLGRLLREVKQL